VGVSRRGVVRDSNVTADQCQRGPGRIDLSFADAVEWPTAPEPKRLPVSVTCMLALLPHCETVPTRLTVL